MSKKKKKQQPRPARPDNDKQTRPDAPLLNEPWIKRSSGFQAMGLLSVVLAVFMAWQLYPTEGWGRAILWGIGFGVAIWAIFGASLAFNSWMRGRREKGRP